MDLEERMSDFGFAIILIVIFLTILAAMSMWLSSLNTAKSLKYTTQIQHVAEDISTTAVNWAIKNGGVKSVDGTTIEDVIEDALDKHEIHPNILNKNNFTVEVMDNNLSLMPDKQHTDSIRGNKVRVKVSGYKIPSYHSYTIFMFSVPRIKYKDGRELSTTGVIHRFDNNY